MFSLLHPALADLLSGPFPERLIMTTKLAFGGCRIQIWSQTPSLVFAATNKPGIWHLRHPSVAGEQWFKCQQPRVYRSTICTVIGKIQGGRLWGRHGISLTLLFLIICRSLKSLDFCLLHVDLNMLYIKKVYSVPRSTNSFINVITGLVGTAEAHYKAGKK